MQNSHLLNAQLKNHGKAKPQITMPKIPTTNAPTINNANHSNIAGERHVIASKITNSTVTDS